MLIDRVTYGLQFLPPGLLAAVVALTAVLIVFMFLRILKAIVSIVGSVGKLLLRLVGIG